MNTTPTPPTEPDDYDGPEQCECEWDWRCGLHAGQYTPQELSNDEWARQESDSAPWWSQ